MYRLFLAIRYLWSRPISWISMVGIWLSVMALIATISVMSGLLAETEAMIRGTTADVLLEPEDPARPPDPSKVLAALEGVDGIRGVSVRIERPALLRPPGRIDTAVVMGHRRYSERNYVRVVGVDPRLEAEVSGFADALRRPLPMGRVRDVDRPFFVDPDLLPEQLRNQDLRAVVVGSRLFDGFRLSRGDVITLVTLPREWSPGERIRPLSSRFVVVGAAQTGHPQHDARAVYMHIDDAREFVEWGRSSYTELGVAATDPADLDGLKGRIERAVEGTGMILSVATWREKNAEFLGAVENERVMLTVLLFFFVAVACFNVFATITVMVTDKTRDIGVLNAMGATSRGVMAVFLLCGMIMTVLSATLGCGSGVLVARYINRLDDLVFHVVGMRIFPEGMYAFSEIPVVIEPGFVGQVFAVTLAVAFLCAYVPARRAARLDPVEALRHE